jgi:hypothetical protein
MERNHERPENLLVEFNGKVQLFSRLEQFVTLAQFEEFLDLALKVLDSDQREVQAEAVSVLTINELREDDDSGSKLISYVVKHIGALQNNSPVANSQRWNFIPLQGLDYDRHLVSFMKIVTHDAFTRSCVEKSFLFVIKAIYGRDGERATNFLNWVIAALEDKSNQDSQKSVVQEGCLLVVRILHNVVRYNAEAVGHRDLVDIHGRLKEVSTRVRTPLSARTDRYLAETGAYLIPVTIRGTEQISSNRTSTSDVRYHQREFLIDLPGELSNLNRRHDNDSALIAKIDILPTKDEVLCDRDPYLPINDISASHFLDGSSRLFDINFRLLREDMIGPLRNAVTTVLEKLRPDVSISKQLSHQDRLHEPNIASTRLYFDVNVESAEFERKCGLKFRLRFRQPERTRALPTDSRKNFWEATRSLDKGSLLCLISNAPDFVCFFTVVEKQLKLLVEDKHWCWIDVIPEGKIDKIREILLQHIRPTRMSESLALVEFPGVLLAAYKPILETLRIRSRHPFIPFSNFLCPKSDERQIYEPRNATVNVRPPLYASPEGFRFDLHTLKNEKASSEPLFISSEASPNDHELLLRLERETTLDSGQCKGLIAGLTQELALIQGDHF